MYDGYTVNNLPCGSSNGVNTYVYALTVYNNKLYVGGSFPALSDNTFVGYIAGWNGSSWSKLGGTPGSSTSYGFVGTVNCLVVYQNLLYIGGSFTTTSTSLSAKYIATFNGTTIANIPYGANNGVGSAVSQFVVYNNKLYIAGSFTTVGGGSVQANRIASWDGSVFANLPCGSSNGLSNIVSAFAIFANKLYIGGYFTTLSNGTQAKYIISWDGSSWSTAIGTNIVMQVNGLGSYKDKLYISGPFTNLADGKIATSIIGWNGTTWSNVFINNVEGISSNAYSILGLNNTLFLGGDFNFLGDGTTPVNYFAWAVV